METAGLVVSVVSIAAIWKTCLFAFDTVEATRRYDSDINTILVKLLVERVRLLQWGEAVGFAGERSREWKVNEQYLLSAINGLLGCVRQAFEDTGALQEKYGLIKDSAKAASTSRRPGLHQFRTPLTPQSAVEKVFKAQIASLDLQRQLPTSTLLQRTKWVVRDKAKFSLLVTEIKGFVDGLYSIVNPEIRRKAQQNLQDEIKSSDDLESLQTLQSAATDDDNLSICVSRRVTALREAGTVSARSSYYAVNVTSPKQFKEHFWGLGNRGFDVLEEQTGIKAKTLEAISSFWGRRAAIEDTYVTQLEQLAHRTFGDEETNAVRELLIHIPESTSQQAESHMELASVIHELQKSCNEMIYRQSEVSNDIQDLSKTLDHKLESEFRLSETEKECTTARIQVDTYLKQVNMTRGDKKARVQTLLEEQRVKEDELSTNLKVCTEDRDRIQQSWVNTWTEFCDRCEDVELRRLQSLASSCVRYGSMVSETAYEDSKVAEKLRSNASSFNADSALQEFIDIYKTTDHDDLEELRFGTPLLADIPMPVTESPRLAQAADISPKSSLSASNRSAEMIKETHEWRKNRKHSLSERAKNYLLFGSSDHGSEF